MSSAVGRGRTLEEAVDAALIELKESRRNVDVKVISEGSDETIVEVSVIAAAPVATATPAEGDDAGAQVAQQSLQQLLTHMGIRADVTIRENGESIVLDITGRDLGMLIGWRGETLRAIQTITNIMVSKQVGPDRRVVVDVERYRQRRENTVREIAFRAARQVKATGDPITLDAMQPFERRAIHLALESDPDVSTESIGEEPDRRVVVGPRKSEA